VPLLDRLILAGRCLWREHTRRKLAVRAADNPVARVQSRAWPRRKRLRRPWKHLRFVVFDTETTGLDPRSDHAVSLGAVSFTDGRIALGQTFCRVIAAEAHPSAESIVVHGLMPGQIANGAGPADVLTEFLLWAGNAVLVAHHAWFDLAMLNRIAISLCQAPIQNLVLDTANLARLAERGSGGRYDLDSLLARYDIPQAGGRHTALGDALLTARLLQKLLKRLGGQGVVRLADLALPAALEEHA